MRWIVLLLCSFLISCGDGSDAPDVSGIDADVKIQRFEADFFSLDTTNVAASLQALERKYPAFLPLYFKFFAPVREIAQQQSIPFDSALVQYLRFITPLQRSAARAFPKTDEVEEDLEKYLKYTKHYFPSFRLPAVLTSVESLNPENPNEIYGTTYYHDTLVISLQMFLGKDYPAYDPTQYPDYIRRRFRPEFIVPNSIRAITSELYLDSSQSATLVEQMIEKGKQWWLMRKLMPDAPDSSITGYTAAQTEWLKAEEGNVWGRVTQNENLFSIEPPTIQTYIGEAPFTQTLPHGDNGQGAPGNIGPWIGWRIIQKFEERNNGLSVNDVLRTTAKKIFEGAKYRPK